MSRRCVSFNTEAEKRAHFSRAVVHGPLVFVSGTAGFRYPDMTLGDTTAEQCSDALTIIGRALNEAGASSSDIVRINYYLNNASDFGSCFPAIRQFLGDNHPAATMIEVSGYSHAGMLIEIEVTAFIQRAGSGGEIISP